MTNQNKTNPEILQLAVVAIRGSDCTVIGLFGCWWTRVRATGVTESKWCLDTGPQGGWRGQRVFWGDGLPFQPLLSAPNGSPPGSRPTLRLAAFQATVNGFCNRL